MKKDFNMRPLIKGHSGKPRPAFFEIGQPVLESVKKRGTNVVKPKKKK